MSLKEQVEALSVELLVRHGHQGFRYRDLADRLGATRAAIHYHYGPKGALIDKVVVAYIEQLLETWARNWSSDARFADKILGMMEANHARFRAFNPNPGDNNPWSLIGRMRLDSHLIGPEAHAAMEKFGMTLERMIVKAAQEAIAKGELAPTMPVQDVALQLAAIADSAGAITQDGGGFARLDRLYRSFARILDDAYGMKGA